MREDAKSEWQLNEIRGKLIYKIIALSPPNTFFKYNTKGLKEAEPFASCYLQPDALHFHFPTL